MTSAQTSELAETQAAEKGTLPDAPLAMPRQILESTPRGSMLRLLSPRATRAGN